MLCCCSSLVLATFYTRDEDSYPVLHPPRHHRPEADIGQPQEHEDKDANEGVEHLQHDMAHDVTTYLASFFVAHFPCNTL